MLVFIVCNLGQGRGKRRGKEGEVYWDGEVEFVKGIWVGGGCRRWLEISWAQEY